MLHFDSDDEAALQWYVSAAGVFAVGAVSLAVARKRKRQEHRSNWNEDGFLPSPHDTAAESLVEAANDDRCDAESFESLCDQLFHGLEEGEDWL